LIEEKPNSELSPALNDKIQRPSTSRRQFNVAATRISSREQPLFEYNWPVNSTNMSMEA